MFEFQNLEVYKKAKALKATFHSFGGRFSLYGTEANDGGSRWPSGLLHVQITFLIFSGFFAFGNIS